jgi:uncharacterized protein YjbI with pentapeptide repeats
MAVHSDVDSETCDEGECVGVRLPSGGRCWAHADPHDLEVALEQLRQGARLDGRGVAFTADLLQRILRSTPQDDEGGPVISTGRFDSATFEGTAEFQGATFEGTAEFQGATFLGDADFTGVTFTGDAVFHAATFMEHTLFTRATFEGRAGFDAATCNRYAEFQSATFGGEAGFGGSTIRGRAIFIGATFRRDAEFDRATFDTAEFGHAIFERARQLGPMMAHMFLILNSALFRERIEIEISAPLMLCRRARFQAGVVLRVRWAQVVMEEVVLGAPSLLSAAKPFESLDESDLLGQPAGEAWPVDTYGTPRLVSVRGLDLSELTLTAVDLRACHFVDAYNLDHIRAEGSAFATAPPGWRWAKRRTIAEEQQWRASMGGQGWYGPECQPPEFVEVTELPEEQAGLSRPGQMAGLYRELRKGMEDRKDEPGAADFYYGEMEMRRHDKWQQFRLERRRGNRSTAIAAGTEYAILWLYWLVSGYGLRAWRALASLAAVVLVASVIFAAVGFTEPNKSEFPTALLFSTQATTALLRGPAEGDLTETGEWLQIALRLVGPVLLGLAVLSVRGRVKR